MVTFLSITLIQTVKRRQASDKVYKGNLKEKDIKIKRKDNKINEGFDGQYGKFIHIAFPPRRSPSY